jgi:hypothetical protein
MISNNKEKMEHNYIAEEIKRIRKKSLQHKSPYPPEKLKKPVAFWIKEDRLMEGIGKALTIILRTRGCSWALDHGGCSMCGYIEDANIDPVDPIYLKNQFDFALNQSLDQIENDNNKYVLKIFNSGSFFDDSEVSKDVRTYIYNQINAIPRISEFTVESRTEYLTPEKLKALTEQLPEKYIEIGIGLESVDTHIRNTYIHKNLSFEDFQKAVELCHSYNIGVKAYLLFKPPLINEKAAIDDCSHSIQKLLDLNVETVSVNPCNVQKGSFVEYLWHSNRYRPPWFYSLFECFLKTLSKQKLKQMRVLCEPSGIGTKRGIHNCLRKECNKRMERVLSEFILHQDLKYLTQLEYDCICRKKYLLSVYSRSS